MLALGTLSQQDHCEFKAHLGCKWLDQGQSEICSEQLSQKFPLKKKKKILKQSQTEMCNSLAFIGN